MTIPTQRVVSAGGTVTAQQKGPNEIFDITIDWIGMFSENEAVDWSDWVIAPRPGGELEPATEGDQQGDGAFVGSYSTIWLKGGKLGTTYVLKNHITTNQDRAFDQTITVVIVAK